MDSISEIVIKATNAFKRKKTASIKFRRNQLKCLYEMIEKNEELFLEALHLDLKKPMFESKMIETDFVLNEIRGMLFNLDSLTLPQKVEKNLVSLFDDAFVYKEPFGLVLIIGTWNYPIMVTLCPLVGAIAAGNVAIIKPSELAPHTAKVLENLVPQYLNQDCYRIINGGAEVTNELLKHKLDYIFFTGSKEVGKLIHSVAAKQSIPVILELGGKSPVYLDDSVKDIECAFKRIIWGKMVNAGQTCVAPDYILCSSTMMNIFLQKARDILTRFFGFNPKESPDYARIVNEKHFNRLEKLIQNTKNVVIGGEMDRQELYIAPTVVAPVCIDDAIMNEEIFGPIIPLVPIESLDEAINYINKGPKPLALYVFSKKNHVIERIMKETSSGSICVNDALVHISMDSLPFGGVGESGLGAYHGKHTFEAFSHGKSVLVRGFNPILEWVGSKRYPPYSQSNLKRLLRLIRKRNIPLGNKFETVLVFILGALALYFFQALLTIIF